MSAPTLISNRVPPAVPFVGDHAMRESDDSKKAELAREKSAMRSSMRRLMESMPKDQAASKAQALAERALSWAPLAHARRVMVYLSMGGEAGTGAMIERLLEAGVEVAGPRVDWEARTITPALIADAMTDVVEGRLGVPEPAPHAPGVPIETIDVLLVPALAFDLRGFRLGRGAGFYDRLLADKRRRGLALGYGFEAQLAHRVPTEPHDARLDALATERRLLEYNGPRIAALLEALGKHPRG
ncbi:MAG: 5-formyltetrahydrofolate cyclo-ligase [Phycisphaeraceae bacterium]|nr:5-formyltetrahydrofolate cyclo-ligase [Phycisphaeraceae bacterium]